MLVVYLSLLDTEEQKNKFEYIYNKYKGMMYYEAYRIVCDQYLAEDIVHETFLNIIRIIDAIRTSTEKETKQFIRILIHNQAIDILRKRNREQREDPETISVLSGKEMHDVEAIAINNIQFELLVEKIQNLSDIYRLPLVLKVQGYKISEIARILEINEQTVKVRLFRARSFLLESLEENYDG